MSSTKTEAFTISISKCKGNNCLGSKDYKINGLIVTVLAIQDSVDFSELDGSPVFKIVKVLSQTNL